MVFGKLPGMIFPALYCGAKIWNEIPIEVKKSPSVAYPRGKDWGCGHPSFQKDSPRDSRKNVIKLVG